MSRRRAKKKELTEKIREEQSRHELSVDVEMTLLALEYVSAYKGEHPIIRSFARQRSLNSRWVPTPSQTAQIHRIATKERLATRDSLGNRLRRRERTDEPSSLDEPNWL